MKFAKFVLVLIVLIIVSAFLNYFLLNIKIINYTQESNPIIRFLYKVIINLIPIYVVFISIFILTLLKFESPNILTVSALTFVVLYLFFSINSAIKNYESDYLFKNIVFIILDLIVCIASVLLVKYFYRIGISFRKKIFPVH